MADKKPVTDPPAPEPAPAPAVAPAPVPPMPTAGRIVWYFKAPIASPHQPHILRQDPWPALVTRVYDREVVSLHIFGETPHSDHVVLSATRSIEPKAGYWMWPPRE